MDHLLYVLTLGTPPLLLLPDLQLVSADRDCGRVFRGKKERRVKVVFAQSGLVGEHSVGGTELERGKGAGCVPSLRRALPLGLGSLNPLHMTSALGGPVQSCSFGSTPLPSSGLGSGIQNHQLWFPTAPCTRHQ